MIESLDAGLQLDSLGRHTDAGRYFLGTATPDWLAHRPLHDGSATIEFGFKAMIIFAGPLPIAMR